MGSGLANDGPARRNKTAGKMHGSSQAYEQQRVPERFCRHLRCKPDPHNQREGRDDSDASAEFSGCFGADQDGTCSNRNCACDDPIKPQPREYRVLQSSNRQVRQHKRNLDDRMYAVLVGSGPYTLLGPAKSEILERQPVHDLTC